MVRKYKSIYKDYGGNNMGSVKKLGRRLLTLLVSLSMLLGTCPTVLANNAVPAETEDEIYIIPNCGFEEEDMDMWLCDNDFGGTDTSTLTMERTQGKAFSGSYSLKVTQSGSSNGRIMLKYEKDLVPVTYGQTYTISMKALNQISNGAVRIDVWEMNESKNRIHNSTTYPGKKMVEYKQTSDDWVTLSGNYTVTDEDTKYLEIEYLFKGNGTCYLDDLNISKKPTILYVGGDGASDENAGTEGEPLATLEAAIKAATDDATITTITLLDDCALPINGYDEPITYDLNGHTLTGDAFTGYSAQVKDSSAGKGLLKVAKGNLILSINEYMPVWDDKNGGYRFSSITISDIEYTSTDALVFAMRPAFASTDIEKLVAAGAEIGEVCVGVRITWPGSTEPYDLPLSNDWLKTMYGGNTAKGVKLTISGGKTITEFTATTIVWSTQCPNVVIAGKTTHTYPATVAE